VSVEKPPQGRHFHLAGVIWLINVGGAATEEPTAAPHFSRVQSPTAAVVDRRDTAAAAEGSRVV